MRTLAYPRSLARRPVRALLAQWPLALADEVEGIHETRVASRRLRELVPALASPSTLRDARRLRARLRAVTRLLGRSRELDVAGETLAAIEAREPAHAEAVALVREHVIRQRIDAGRGMRRGIGRVDVANLAAGTLALAGRSESPAAIRACSRRVAARLERRALQLESAVVDAGLIFAPGPLHAVRIAFKKFRYALEVAERFGRFRLKGAMRRLKRMQNLLGDLHDLQVLGGMTRDVLAQAPASQRQGCESLVRSIDDEIRALHSQFVIERDQVVYLLAGATHVQRTLISLPAPARRRARPAAKEAR
jgi:CHAD domain-containing protein